ncbi:alpha/beta hydrolase family protein [Nevskia ramosa]|uniref:alpha/beta hydrolase family protein n=1 Tax=Nevskia ramosa TaxID=64002 RepID=UPI0009FF14A6|nr:alpha/beta hydrolase [Nevskia ramosa]
MNGIVRAAGRWLSAAALATAALPLAAHTEYEDDAAAMATARVEEEVRFRGASDEVMLAGTLSRPAYVARDLPVPAVVLIHGSGPNDRDETLYGHKPFRMLAAAFESAGYAVLRYDKRGVGESGGNLRAATLVDYAADAEAAFDYLRSRPDIDATRIGLLGHSEGGMIAPMIAARRSDVAWLVLLAPPTVPGRAISEYQNVQGALDRGASEQAALAAAAEAGRLFDILQADLPTEQRDARLCTALQRIGEQRQLSPAFVEGQRQSLSSPWFRHILSYDPAPVLEKIRKPALVLFGAMDHQIAPSLNEGPARAALKGNAAAEVRVLPGVNHLFLNTHSGAVSEYPRLGGGLSPVLLDTLQDWLAVQSRRGPDNLIATAYYEAP